MGEELLCPAAIFYSPEKHLVKKKRRVINPSIFVNEIQTSKTP
jgi:hypothetical protein